MTHYTSAIAPAIMLTGCSTRTLKCQNSRLEVHSGLPGAVCRSILKVAQWRPGHSNFSPIAEMNAHLIQDSQAKATGKLANLMNTDKARG